VSRGERRVARVFDSYGTTTRTAPRAVSRRVWLPHLTQNILFSGRPPAPPPAPLARAAATEVPYLLSSVLPYIENPNPQKPHQEVEGTPENKQAFVTMFWSTNRPTAPTQVTPLFISRAAHLASYLNHPDLKQSTRSLSGECAEQSNRPGL
jgi:hypothetical protein